MFSLFQRITAGAALSLSLASTLWAAAVTDQDYINYQVSVQTALYKYSEDPTKLAAEMQGISEKYKPDSKDWETYSQGLSKDPTRVMKLHQNIEEQLKKNGIQWGGKK